MLLNSAELSVRLQACSGNENFQFRIVPSPDFNELRLNGTASIDFRLGRWFRTFRQASLSTISLTDESEQMAISKEHFVRFGASFLLHPGKFVLGATLEWISLPLDLAGYVTGKSSWGRRGLIIETAAGIHPAFSGCLALELTNVGEVPIVLNPGMPICQIFFHEVKSEKEAARSQFNGRRKPTLGRIKTDRTLERLSKGL